MPNNTNYIEMLKLWYVHTIIWWTSSCRLPLSSTNRTQRLPMIWCMFFCPNYFLVLYSIHTYTNEYVHKLTYRTRRHRRGLVFSPQLMWINPTTTRRKLKRSTVTSLAYGMIIHCNFFRFSFLFSSKHYMVYINKVSNKTIIF